VAILNAFGWVSWSRQAWKRRMMSAGEWRAISWMTLFGIPSGPGALSFFVLRIARLTSSRESSAGTSKGTAYSKLRMSDRSATGGGVKCVSLSNSALLRMSCATRALCLRVESSVVLSCPGIFVAPFFFGRCARFPLVYLLRLAWLI